MLQNTQEWMDARKNRITGSRVGAILGHSPYGNRDTVMREMVRQSLDAETEFKGNVATEWGSKWEPEAIADYEEQKGVFVRRSGFETYQDWAGCSVDGFVDDDGMIEAKCPYGLRLHAHPVFKPINDLPHYYDQIQWNLFITCKRWCDFIQWTPSTLEIERVYANPDWISRYMSLVREFHASFLTELSSPDAHLNAIVSVRSDKAWKAAAIRFNELKIIAEDAKAKLEEAREILINLAEDKASEGEGVKVSKIRGRVTTNYKKLLSDNTNIDITPYQSAGEPYWRVT